MTIVPTNLPHAPDGFHLNRFWVGTLDSFVQTKPLLPAWVDAAENKFMPVAARSTQEDLEAWITANRYVPELNCEQRLKYNVFADKLVRVSYPIM
jgi:hypothetical protein